MFLDALRNVYRELYNVMQSIGWIDVLDIVILTYVVFAVLKLVRETRAGQLMKGIALLVSVYVLSSFIGLEAVSWLISKVLDIGVLAIIILFQPELRRVLEKFGQTTSALSRFTLGSGEGTAESWNTAIPVICEACAQLSQTSTGALIVIERGTKLGEQILNGTVMKALPSVELFGNIFYNKTPLHDGAVIMRDGIIWAAACFLPKPQKEELVDKHLGSRHRAAIGMSENSDAIIIVVSEETGAISVAQDGVLTRNYTKETLEIFLRSKLIQPETETWFRKRSENRRGRDAEAAEEAAEALKPAESAEAPAESAETPKPAESAETEKPAEASDAAPDAAAESSAPAEPAEAKAEAEPAGKEG